MSVDMFAIWGLGSIPKAEGSEAGGEDMDDGFGGIGEQGGAIGHPPRKQFSDKHRDGDSEAETHCAFEGGMLGCVCQMRVPFGRFLV